MFDARYHALSLAAVLFALVIGLLLGVAIGDQQLVAGARDSLREELRQDVRDARAQAAEARATIDRLESYAEQTYPALVADRLDGRRIVLVFLGERDPQITEHVRTALEPSGGELAAVATLREPVDLAAVAAAAIGTRYAGVIDEPELLAELGERVGTQIVQGGRLVEAVRRSLFASSAGRLAGAEGIVVVRTPLERIEDEQQRERAGMLEMALVDGLDEFATPVVGVETTDTDPSQVGWYREQGISSVDHVDTVAGRAALVYALDGAAGAYGVKPSADALVPETLRGSTP